MIVHCKHCSIKFNKFPKDIKKTSKNFCSLKCTNDHSRVQTTCTNCGVQITKQLAETKKSKNYFCSRSCAAKFNNKIKPKRNKIKQCKTCKGLVYSNRTYCESCVIKGNHLNGNKFDSNKTIGYYTRKNQGPNRYSYIRQLARKITNPRPQICIICNYDKHVETCHKKPISRFSLTTKIKIINAESNLVLLCKNCHWELDHDILKI